MAIDTRVNSSAAVPVPGRDLYSRQVVRVSDAYIGFDIAGEDAQAVLAQATPLDIHTAIFPPGSASFTEFFGQTALISRKSERNRFTAYVPRSHADYLEACLRYAKG